MEDFAAHRKKRTMHTRHARQRARERQSRIEHMRGIWRRSPLVSRCQICSHATNHCFRDRSCQGHLASSRRSRERTTCRQWSPFPEHNNDKFDNFLHYRDRVAFQFPTRYWTSSLVKRTAKEPTENSLQEHADMCTCTCTDLNAEKSEEKRGVRPRPRRLVPPGLLPASSRPCG